MATKETIQAQIKEAMKQGDTVRRDALRLVMAAVKNAEIEKGGALDQSELDRVLQKEVKQRRDSITEFQAAGRTDLVDQEQAGLVIIEALLPQQMSEDEVRQVAAAHIARSGAADVKDIGKVMGPLMGELRGKADGALIQRVVKELLSGGAVGGNSPQASQPQGK